MLTSEEIKEILAENGKNGERVTLAEAARRAGLHKAAVSRFVKRRPGLLGDDSLLDAEEIGEALAGLKSSTKHQSQPKVQNRPGRKTVKAAPGIVAASNAKLQADARKAEASAQRQEIAARRDAGELLERAAVLHLNRQIIGAARNRLASIPDQMADTLAHLDADQINTLLTAEIEAVLKELSRLTLQYERPSPPMGGR